MVSLHETYSNIQINDVSKTKGNVSNSLSISTKDEIVSISGSTLKTSNDSQKNQIITIKKTNKEKRRTLTPGKLFSKKFVIFTEQEFSLYKEKSALNLIHLTKINKISDKNKNALKNNEIDKNIKNIAEKKQEDKKKVNVYHQTFSRSDFAEKAPSIPGLYLHVYNFKNKNCFSCVNNTIGKINESDKIPNIYYNHLIIQNSININDISFCCTSVSKRYKKKLSYIVYYSPKLL